MYCIQCGVKLSDTESRCPLCGVAVYHPELTREPGEPLYPRHRYLAAEAASKAAQIVMSAGIDMIIANGKKPQILYKIVDGEAVGTKFVGKK